MLKQSFNFSVQPMRPHPGVRMRAAMLAGWVMGCLMISGNPAYAADKEALVKSAYLYNFTKFIAWPQIPDQITVCAFGKNMLGNALKDIEKESTPQYPVLVQPDIAPLAITGCQMVYIDSREDSRESELLSIVHERPILTVGEGREFIEQGGMIAFVNDASHIKIEINLKAAEKAGLKLDPQLLEVARRVVR